MNDEQSNTPPPPQGTGGASIYPMPRDPAAEYDAKRKLKSTILISNND